MITKPKNSKRKFIPVSIADSLKTVNKKFSYKFGKLEYTIHAKWSEIVGNFFINHSEPKKIISIANSKNENNEVVYDQYLHVNVSPPAALEFQHFQDKIIEKINAYFGYRAIKGIRIHQNYIPNNDLNISKNKNFFYKDSKKIKNIQKSIPKLSNKELEESIVNLGLSITYDNE